MDVPSFLTTSGSSDFLKKQKNLLNVLDSAEKSKSPSNVTTDKYMEVELKSNKRKRKETKHFRGKESLFKEPIELPLRFKKKSGNLPDFKKNPHKWVKYSLADITQNDMSNESNTAAALSFLNEMKIQKEQLQKMDVDESEDRVLPNASHKFCLRKEAENVEDKIVDSEKAVFKSTKLIMPEYVIGQVKKTTKVSKKKLSGEKSKEIFLNHIHEYEDE